MSAPDPHFKPSGKLGFARACRRGYPVLEALDKEMLLAKVLAAAYVVFGVFALIAVSIRDNRRDMFYGSGREWVGTLRLLHAYVASLSMVACGITVWLWPAAAANLAWTVLGVLVLGKAISVASGGGMKCVRCLVAGITVALLAAIAITVGTH